METKEIWSRLYNRLENAMNITEDTQLLMKFIVENSTKYQKLLSDISGNGSLDDSAITLIGIKRKEVVERVQLMALKDKKVTIDEKNLVNETVQIVKDLEQEMKDRLKNTIKA